MQLPVLHARSPSLRFFISSSQWPALPVASSSGSMRLLRSRSPSSRAARTRRRGRAARMRCRRLMGPRRCASWHTPRRPFQLGRSSTTTASRSCGRSRWPCAMMRTRGAEAPQRAAEAAAPDGEGADSEHLGSGHDPRCACRREGQGQGQGQSQG